VIAGIGADIVEIDRIRESLGRFGERFARRILTSSELTEWRTCAAPERLLAKRFAAKEAVVKALGLGFRRGLAFNLIGVGHDGLGKPEIFYEGAALELVRTLGIEKSLITISDERRYAVAFVVLTRSMGSASAVPSPFLSLTSTPVPTSGSGGVNTQP
jgi:holo-[acyl-carrier protein] synthase